MTSNTNAASKLLYFQSNESNKEITSWSLMKWKIGTVYSLCTDQSESSSLKDYSIYSIYSNFNKYSYDTIENVLFKKFY